MPLFVSTLMRVRFAAFSDTSFVFTRAVSVASSTVAPADLPVIDWQPASETTNSTATKLFNSRFIATPPFRLKSDLDYKYSAARKTDNWIITEFGSGDDRGRVKENRPESMTAYAVDR